MVTDRISYSECTGCSACANICPKKIIKLNCTDDGFEVPLISKEECIHCGLCEDVCPCLGAVTKTNHFTKGFAVWSYDPIVRNQSTSGGVFTEISKQIINQGGKVAGAKFDDNSMVSHCLVSSLDDMIKLRQSKYVQSQKNFIFSEIKKELEKGTNVMFVGTPCEVAGLKLFLGKDYMSLFTCDFICKGAASPKAYRAYLDELIKKYKSEIIRVWFKEKSLGWNHFSTKIMFANGKTYKKDRYHDWYMRGYVEENLFLRESCAACKFKGKHRFSDVTLADFWGAGKIDRRLDYDLGTSLVITNTAKGESMLDSISENIFIKPVSLDKALSGNYAYYNSIIPSINRDCFFADLEHKLFSEAVKKYAYKGFLTEIKREIRNKIHWVVRKGRIFFNYLRSI